jgi:hypothetical protein
VTGRAAGDAQQWRVPGASARSGQPWHGNAMPTLAVDGRTRTLPTSPERVYYAIG